MGKIHAVFKWCLEIGCKGLCDRFRHAAKKAGNLCYYSPENPDNKFCASCQCKMLWPEIKCPCCNMKLRTRPRNYKIIEEAPAVAVPLVIEIENTPSDPDFEVLLPMALIAV